ncbi:DUF1501 domain-containing protein [Tahibacter amnicola]|uniref:DUF1501 domain-containing protein n=1 Tax=Tahibacter amnicola TaxID=2976241 RepID=A0ABY6BF33_9GAMM|nr:DUF1501 domain-containing protein [Tahibacter amnicola]UXI67226.1 DUF1501 domain-containing protein [Tahibacter amnicola]
MDRRAFLSRTVRAALGGVAATSMLGQMRLVEAATTASLPRGDAGYRALVCLFLYGGNDSVNTIVPIDGVARSAYQGSRGTLQLPVSALLPLTPVAGGAAPSDGCRYGLQSAIRAGDAVGTSGLRDLFATGKAAVVCNVGTLVRPTTKPQYQTPGFSLPPQLFSHDDQQTYWQTSRPDSSLGWGGRIADLLYATNSNTVLPMTMTIGGENVLQRGAVVNQYALNPHPQGAVPISAIENSWNAPRRDILREMNAPEAQAHRLERAFARSMNRAIDNYGMVATALAGAPNVATVFPDTRLGAQLRMVARLVAARQTLGMQRQIFFVSAGGFDTHDTQLADHPGLLSDVARSLAAFYAATVELGVAESVTTFTASDFGRTLSSNGDGSDHGWGGHHFVIGDAVRGGSFYGAMPSLTVGGQDDAGWGQVIPTLSVDQYGATLARWFGVGSSLMSDIFPNIGNFPVADIGFMR